MRHLGVFLLLVGATVSLTGCGQMFGTSANSRGGIAVVDLDKVASETGRDRILLESLKMAQNSLNQDYARNLKSAQEQLEEKKKEYGASISDNEKKEFAQLEQNAISQLTQIKSIAQTNYRKYEMAQVEKFRAELKPIAQEIANKRGLGIVIPKNPALLLSVDPGVDITEDVIKVLREKHPVKPVTESTPAESTARRRPAKEKSGAPARIANAAAEDEEEEPVR